MIRRRYCWMVGVPFEMADDGKCPECSQPAQSHWQVPEGICGCYAPDPKNKDSNRGYPCTLLPGHDGQHVKADETAFLMLGGKS